MRTIRQRLQHDDGVGLVEILVALSILAVVLSATASTLTTALSTQERNESRTAATALANAEIETLRALPWGSLGFYTNDFTAATGPAPAGWVNLDQVLTTRPGGSPAPLPRSTSGRYDIRRQVTWVNDPGTAGAFDFKRMRVEVRWTDRTIAQSTVVESDRSPAPTDQAGSDFSLSTFDATPDVVIIDAAGTPVPTPARELTARTSARATFVYVRFALRDGSTQRVDLLNPSGDGVRWSAPNNGGTYRNGDVNITFFATRNPNPDIVEVIGNKLVRFVQPLDVRSLTVDPTGTVCVVEGGEPPALRFTSEIWGLVETDDVNLLWPGNEEPADDIANSVSGSTFAIDVPAASYAALPAGTPRPADVTTTFELRVRRAVDGATATRQLPVTVRHVATAAECTP